MKHSFLALAVVLSSINAFANSANIRTFQPGSGHYYLFSEDALMDTRREFTLGVTYDYLNDPLVRTDADHKRETGDVITALHTLDLQGTYRFGSQFLVGGGIPLHLVRPTNDTHKFSMSDMRVFGKFRVTPDDNSSTHLAVMLDLRFPSGEERYFLSDTSVGIGTRLVLEHDFKILKIAANAGFMYAPSSSVTGQSLSFKKRIPLSISGWIPIGSKWAINLEGGGHVIVPLNEYQNPSDAYVGAQYRPMTNLTIVAGGSVGNFDGVGSNDFRILAGLRASFDSSDDRPLPPPPVVKAPEPKKPEPVHHVSTPRVKFTDKAIIITEEVKFETDKDILTKSGEKLLDEVADVMKANQAYYKTITIEGHTDERGSDAYNMRLSDARANSVKEYLTSRGVPSGRLLTVGYGERRRKSVKMPKMSAERRYAIDRRVEFKVNKK